MQMLDVMTVDKMELRGFSRTVAELEWLLLILVLFYFVVPGTTIYDEWGYILSMMVFAGFVISFRYSKLFTAETRWKLAIETWAMIIFITWIVYNTGGINSPLLNMYLLVIVTSALTLGKVTTLLEFILITAVYFYLGHAVYVENTFSLINFCELMILFAPFLLTGYLTSMLAADVQNGREILELMSETDEMTGLRNRRSFKKAITAELKKAIRYSRSFSIMMIDADNLKAINDQFGHGTGDKLIKSVAESIRESLRDSDILARFGGDEFIVMLPETDAGHAQEAGERIRKSVENTSFSVDGNRISSTVSIGIASYPQDSTAIEDLLGKADEALYQSKGLGKNVVSSYTEETVSTELPS